MLLFVLGDSLLKVLSKVLCEAVLDSKALVRWLLKLYVNPEALTDDSTCVVYDTNAPYTVVLVPDLTIEDPLKPCSNVLDSFLIDIELICVFFVSLESLFIDGEVVSVPSVILESLQTDTLVSVDVALYNSALLDCVKSPRTDKRLLYVSCVSIEELYVCVVCILFLDLGPVVAETLVAK